MDFLVFVDYVDYCMVRLALSICSAAHDEGVIRSGLMWNRMHIAPGTRHPRWGSKEPHVSQKLSLPDQLSRAVVSGFFFGLIDGFLHHLTWPCRLFVYPWDGGP